MENVPDRSLERNIGVVVSTEAVSNSELTLSDHMGYLGDPGEGKQNPNQHITKNRDNYGLDQ